MVEKIIKEVEKENEDNEKRGCDKKKKTMLITSRKENIKCWGEDAN